LVSWRDIWPLPIAALPGWRSVVGKAAVAFSLAFLPAYYLREFQSYGVFWVPTYVGVALAVLAISWLLDQLGRPAVARPTPRTSASWGNG